MAHDMRRDEAWLAEYMAHFRKQTLTQTVHTAKAAQAGITIVSVAPSPVTVSATIKQDRYKSETERRFAQHCAIWKYEGTVREWWYEPMAGFYLAPKTTYTPDFLLDVNREQPPQELQPFLAETDRFVFIETKGEYIREKDWIKAKTAAARYDCFRFVLAQWVQQQWTYTLIPPV